jgi:hypothetical protein
VTAFSCEQCSCDCPPICAIVSSNCFEVSFSGFASNVSGEYPCTVCDTIDQYTFLARRGARNALRARAVAVRPETLFGEQSATFSVVLTQDEKTGSYSVTSISVIDGGSGYVPGTKIAIEYGRLFGSEFLLVGAEVRCDRSPFAWITEIGRGEPAVTAELSCSGSTPQLSVSLRQESESEQDYWAVDSVSVGAFGGTGCTDGATVFFSAPGAEEEQPASAVARTGRSQPMLEASVDGSPVFASITFVESQDESGKSFWGVQSVLIFDPVEVGQAVTFSPPEGVTVLSAASAEVESVDEFSGTAIASVLGAGQYYADSGVVESVEVSDGGRYYRAGQIKAVTVAKGGEIYDTSSEPCVFRGNLCVDCPEGIDRQSVGGEIRFFPSGQGISATLALSLSDGFVSGTADDISPDATSVTFSSLTQSACATPGTVTINAVDCDAETLSPCEPMPQQIELEISGISSAGVLIGATVDQFLASQARAAAECDISSNGVCFSSAQPAFGQQAGTAGFEDARVVLDLVAESCGSYTYSGLYPTTWSAAYYPDELLCGQMLTPSVEIQQTPCSVVVTATRTSSASDENFLCPPGDTCPPDGTEADATLAVATAEDGEIVSISVESPGSCYAWRVFDYLEPEATVSTPASMGEGAEFTVVWQQAEDSQQVWEVAYISGSGGTGYTDNDSVTLEPDEGSCGSGFTGYIITTRVEPELEISVQSPGSGAELSYTLSQLPASCSVQYGIRSGTVIEPGDGYTDGDAVVISGGDPDDEAIVVIDVERTEPDITAGVGTATLTVVLQESVDLSGKAIWSVASVSVEDGGEGGVENGAAVVFSVEADVSSPPSATVTTDDDGVVLSVEVLSGGVAYNETGPIAGVTVLDGGNYCGDSDSEPPELVPTLPAGTGGEIGLSILGSRTLPCNQFWEFDSVDVDDPGDGYRDRTEIDVSLGSEAQQQSPATLIVRVERTEPTISASVGNATLSVSLTETTDSLGDAVWTVSSVTVIDGGSGISQDDPVSFVADSGSIVISPLATATVDEDGSVTEVSVSLGGEMVDDIGPIESVEINDGGRYWATDGSVACVVGNGGQYYKAVPSGVEVAEPEIEILSLCGSGAEAEAVVDADPDSATFGGIASITITNGGEDYFPLGNAYLIRILADLFGLALGHLSPPISLLDAGPFTLYAPSAIDGDVGNDLDFADHEPLANRVSLLCPADLLDREYRMWSSTLGAGMLDAENEQCGKFYLPPAGVATRVRRFGDQDIKCTIRPL